MTVGHTSVIEKIEQMGKRFDEKVLNCKVQQVCHKRFTVTLGTIKECVEEAVPAVEPTNDRNLKRQLKTSLGNKNIINLMKTFIRKSKP